MNPASPSPLLSQPDPFGLDLITRALDRAMRLQALRAQVVALWPDWVSAPSIAAGELVDECTWVDAFGATWGLDSTVPYLIPDAGQYDAAPAAYDRRLACMMGEAWRFPVDRLVRRD